MTEREKLIKEIEKTSDRRQLFEVLQDTPDPEVQEAVCRRLVSLETKKKSGTVEFEFWQMVVAYEIELFKKHGRAYRATRTRKMAGDHGILETIRRLTLRENATAGACMLIQAGKAEFTVEAIVTRHEKRFSVEVRVAAHLRLEEAKNNPGKFKRKAKRK